MGKNCSTFSMYRDDVREILEYIWMYRDVSILVVESRERRRFASTGQLEKISFQVGFPSLQSSQFSPTFFSSSLDRVEEVLGK